MTDLGAAIQSAARASGAPEAEGLRPLPPVHLWNPAHCGDIDIRIARDGTWFHEGSPIGREALVRLFSTVLRKDPDGYHLVTPAEKLRIQVDDMPFLAVELRADGETLSFRTNVGDWVVADAGHPITVTLDAATGEPAPSILVRGDLTARLVRPVFYELVELAEVRQGYGGPEYAVCSGGVWFPLGPAEPA